MSKILEFPEKTDAELKQLAIDIYDNKVFTDRHIRPEDEQIIMSIFLPIGLGSFAGFEISEMEKIGLIYEYMSEAGPRSINGYPNFMSFKLINVEQADRMGVFYNEYKTMKENFVKS